MNIIYCIDLRSICMAPAVGVFSHGPVGAQDDDFFSNKYP